MLEKCTIGTDDSLPALTRYVYSNHLQSASLEMDEIGDIISYEEYHPYGTTAFQAKNATINAVAKRYRYTGKERDEESGLYYHGARYYVPWLCKWTAIDPMESKYAGMSPYNYSFNNPVMWNDPSGADPDKGNHRVDNAYANLGPAVPTMAYSPTGGSLVLPSDAEITKTFGTEFVNSSNSFIQGGYATPGSVHEFQYRGETYEARFFTNTESTFVFAGYYSQTNENHYINGFFNTLPTPQESTLSIRLEGIGKALFGTVEAAIGALTIEAGGGFALVHGSDIFGSGASQAISGERTSSFTQYGLSYGYQAAGLSPEQANITANAVDMGFSLVFTGGTSSSSYNKGSTLSRGSAEGHGYAASVTEGGTGKAFAGHGSIELTGGNLTVPKGTSLTIWAAEGNSIPDAMGKLIEMGKYDEVLSNPKYVDLMLGNGNTRGAATYLPGASMPRFILSSPDNLNIMSNSFTTMKDYLPINKMLNRNMGKMHWAACTIFN